MSIMNRLELITFLSGLSALLISAQESNVIAPAIRVRRQFGGAAVAAPQQSYGGGGPVAPPQQSYGGGGPVAPPQQSYGGGGPVAPVQPQQSYGGGGPVAPVQQSYGGGGGGYDGGAGFAGGVIPPPQTQQYGGAPQGGGWIPVQGGQQGGGGYGGGDQGGYGGGQVSQGGYGGGGQQSWGGNQGGYDGGSQGGYGGGSQGGYGGGDGGYGGGGGYNAAPIAPYANIPPATQGYGPAPIKNGTCDHLKKPKKQFLGYVYKTDTAPDLDSCIDKCVKDQPKCKSGHWFSDSKECYLKAESEKGRPDLLVDVAEGSRDITITYFEPCINGVPPRRKSARKKQIRQRN